VRALAIVHKYPPVHNAGAEWMLHTVLRDWRARGAEVFVVYPGAPSYELHGITVGPQPQRGLEGLCRDVDVVVTHLDNTGAATRAARIAGRPIVHLLHNDRQLQYHNVKPGADVLLVSNSEWIARTIPKGYASVICRPPVITSEYAVDRADAHYVTLVNRTEPKGAVVLFQLAELAPERRFLAVAGAYGVQMRPPSRVRNVRLIAQTANIRDDVYRATRVLVMPSSYESWGRVAVEAMASGIPVIAHPTPGLTEALGDAGIFADRRDVGEWLARLAELDDAGRYADVSERARARAHELERITDRDLARTWRAVTALAGASPYDSTMILSSRLTGLRTSGECPVCGAAGCSCSPGEVGERLTRGVTIIDAVRPGGAIAVYRTFRGDFRFTPAGAQRAGLVPTPDDDRLPAAVERRFHRDAWPVLRRAYAGASERSRARFLSEVAELNPGALADRAAELVAELAKGVPASTPAPREPVPAGLDAGTIPEGRAGDVLEWAGQDPERLGRALEAELAGKARKTLIAELERRMKG
jgi:glycosyltransferase involved in cell wall biosynthesis